MRFAVWLLDRCEHVMDGALETGNQPVFYTALLGWYGVLVALSLCEGST